MRFIYFLHERSKSSPNAFIIIGIFGISFLLLPVIIISAVVGSGGLILPASVFFGVFISFSICSCCMEKLLNFLKQFAWHLFFTICVLVMLACALAGLNILPVCIIAAAYILFFTLVVSLPDLLYYLLYKKHLAGKNCYILAKPRIFFGAYNRRRKKYYAVFYGNKAPFIEKADDKILILNRHYATEHMLWVPQVYFTLTCDCESANPALFSVHDGIAFLSKYYLFHYVGVVCSDNKARYCVAVYTYNKLSKTLASMKEVFKKYNLPAPEIDSTEKTSISDALGMLIYNYIHNDGEDNEELGIRSAELKEKDTNEGEETENENGENDDDSDDKIDAYDEKAVEADKLSYRIINFYRFPIVKKIAGHPVNAFWADYEFKIPNAPDRTEIIKYFRAENFVIHPPADNSALVTVSRFIVLNSGLSPEQKALIRVYTYYNQYKGFIGRKETRTAPYLADRLKLLVLAEQAKLTMDTGSPFDSSFGNKLDVFSMGVEPLQRLIAGFYGGMTGVTLDVLNQMTDSLFEFAKASGGRFVNWRLTDMKELYDILANKPQTQTASKPWERRSNVK